LILWEWGIAWAKSLRKERILLWVLLDVVSMSLLIFGELR